jgi:hypothetical protein
LIAGSQCGDCFYISYSRAIVHGDEKGARERERVEESLAVQLRMRRWMHVAITWSFNSSENDFKAGAEPPTVLNDLN